MKKKRTDKSWGDSGRNSAVQEELLIEKGVPHIIAINLHLCPDITVVKLT